MISTPTRETQMGYNDPCACGHDSSEHSWGEGLARCLVCSCPWFIAKNDIPHGDRFDS